MTNITTIILQQLNARTLVIQNVNIDCGTDEVIIRCVSRNAQQPQTTESVISGNIVCRDPEIKPQPSGPLTIDQKAMLLFAELCGVHDNIHHAKRSLQRIIADTNLDTAEKVVARWVERCTPRNGDIPQEAKNVMPLMLKPGNNTNAS